MSKEKISPGVYVEKNWHGGPWRCFHCDEVFITKGAAEDHFGNYINSTPGCILKVQLGNERGWLMELRRLQEENSHLRQQMNEEYWNQTVYHAHLETNIQSYRPFRKCRSLQDVYHVFDSMEGRALSAERRLLAHHLKEPCPICDTMHEGCCCGRESCGWCGSQKSEKTAHQTEETPGDL